MNSTCLNDEFRSLQTFEDKALLNYLAEALETLYLLKQDNSGQPETSRTVIRRQ